MHRAWMICKAAFTRSLFCSYRRNTLMQIPIKLFCSTCWRYCGFVNAIWNTFNTAKTTSGDDALLRITLSKMHWPFDWKNAIWISWYFTWKIEARRSRTSTRCWLDIVVSKSSKINSISGFSRSIAGQGTGGRFSISDSIRTAFYLLPDSSEHIKHIPECKHQWFRELHTAKHS